MKTATKVVTFGVIPLLLVGIIAYDVYAILQGGAEASISALIIKSSYEMPFMTFSVGFVNGVLAGHLFWRMRPNEMTKDIDTKNT